MTDQPTPDKDGAADAIAAIAVVGIVIFALYLWLSGMPG